MKLLGFSVAKDNIAVEREGEYFDLHNNFDFRCYSYKPAERVLVMIWDRGRGNWVKATDPSELSLVFSGVSLFRVRERDPDLPVTEDGCLEFLGFVWDDMLDQMSAFTSHHPKEGCTHFIARFMSASSIKVGADSVSLHVAGRA